MGNFVSTTRTASIVLGLLCALAPSLADAQSRDSSVRPSPHRLNVGDINGDGMHDWVGLKPAGDNAITVRLGSNLSYANPSNFYISYMNGGGLTMSGNSVLYPGYTFVGRFLTTWSDDVCVYSTVYTPYLGSQPRIDCYHYYGTGSAGLYKFGAIPGGATELAWTMPAARDPLPPVRSNPGDARAFAVGDFDGDGFDEVMTYNRNDGSSPQFWRFNSGQGQFVLNPNVNLGNIAGFKWAGGIDVLAGEISGPDGNGARRDDLLFYNRSTKQVSGYYSAMVAGKATFHWMYTMSPPVGPADQLALANVGGGTEDALVALDTTNGKMRFLEVTDWSKLGMPIPGVVQGDVQSPSGQEIHALWASTANVVDDLFVFTKDDVFKSLYPTVYNGTRTYWSRGTYGVGYIYQQIGM